MSVARATPSRSARRFRWKHTLLVAVAVVAIGALAQLLGWNLRHWFDQVWNSIGVISGGEIVAAFVLATLQAAAAGFAYYSILRFAYPEAGVRYLEVFAMYAASVALNTILPASLGTLVLVSMFTAVFTGVTFAGALAVVGVQKIFYVALAVFLYLYAFLTIGGSFDLKFGFVHAHPWPTVVLLLAAVVAAGLLVHLFWPRAIRWFQEAKTGGQIVAHPRSYVARVLLPEAISWSAYLGMIAVVLVGYAIPVSLGTVIRLVAYGSIAGITSVTPGGAGVNQAFAVAALRHVTTATTATASSIGQQVLTTTWSLVLAGLLMLWAFGWSGGLRLVEASYTQAKEAEEEHEASRKAKRRLKPAG